MFTLFKFNKQVNQLSGGFQHWSKNETLYISQITELINHAKLTSMVNKHSCLYSINYVIIRININQAKI